VTEYEILLLLDAELPDERQEEIVVRARELIERSGGRFESHNAWGQRRLAYEINRKADGAYHLLSFTSDSDTLDEVSRVLKITDGVLRHMAVRRPAPAKRPAVQPPVRDSGPGEGARGNREVSPATTEGSTTGSPATERQATESPTTAPETAEAEGAVSVGQPEE
jgi:small subunit ribosomal protein S6